MIKRLILSLIFVFILLNLGVLADENITNSTTSVIGFDETISYNWLKIESEKEGLSIQSLSMSILALNNKQQYDIGKQVITLKERGNSDSQCWPAGACNTIDTAYALLALKSVGEDVSKGLEWLNKTLSVDSQGMNKWVIVIDSKMNGSCKIGFDTILKDFNIENNKIKGKYTISLSDLGNINKPLPVINYDCSTLPAGSDLVVAIGYDKSENERFIIGTGKKELIGSIVIPNTCFSSKAGTGCDYDSTLFVSWAIAEMNEDINKYGTYVYLETTNQQNLNTLKTAFLTRFLQASVLSGSTLVPNYYVNLLSSPDLQKSDGSWNSDIYSTAVAVFALTPSSDKSDLVAKGKEFLEKKWKPSGYWTTNFAENSWALIAISGEKNFISGYVNVATTSSNGTSNIETNCQNNIDDDINGLTDCDDVACATSAYCLTCKNNIQDPGEEGIDCGGDVCLPCTGTSLENQTQTINDEVGFLCEDGIDNNGNGLIDCEDSSCKSESICSKATPECTSKAECSEGKDCVGGKCIVLPKEESGSLTWLLWLVLILIIIGGGIYFYFFWIKTGKFKFGKKPSGPSFEDYKRQRENIISSRPTVLPQPVHQQTEKPIQRKDDELELALKKAEKILHGK